MRSLHAFISHYVLIYEKQFFSYNILIFQRIVLKQVQINNQPKQLTPCTNHAHLPMNHIQPSQPQQLAPCINHVHLPFSHNQLSQLSHLVRF